LIRTGARLTTKKQTAKEREPWLKKARCPNCGKVSTFKVVLGETICENCGRAV